MSEFYLYKLEKANIQHAFFLSKNKQKIIEEKGTVFSPSFSHSFSLSLLWGFYNKPQKAQFIPTFCKRINRTQPAVEIWVRAFEERKTNHLYVQQNLYTTTTTINRVLHQME